MSGQSENSVVSQLMEGFYDAAKNAKMKQMDDANVENVEDEEDDDADDIYEVDHIMDTKLIKGVRHFFVRWKGYDETEDSWEPEDNVAGAKDIVANFMANYKPKGKQGRPPKAASTPKSAPRKRRSRSHEASKEDEPENEPESEDDDYAGKSKRKKKKADESASTSHNSQPKAKKGFSPVSALNLAVKRKMNSNLRWLEDDSDGNASDGDSKIPILTPIQPKPVEDIPPELSIADTSTEKTKEKKKKKKSKKHSKDRERSNSPSESRRSTNNNPPPSEAAKVTVLGVYRPDDSSKNEFRFIVRNHSTNQDTIMTLAEAFLADGWQLCRYLASRIHFRANGEYQVEVNGETKK